MYPSQQDLRPLSITHHLLPPMGHQHRGSRGPSSRHPRVCVQGETPPRPTRACLVGDHRLSTLGQDPLDERVLSHSESTSLRVKAHARLATTRRLLASAGGRPTQTAPVPVASNLRSRLSTSPIRWSDAVLLRTETWCAGPPRAGSTANTARHAGILHDAPFRATPRGTPRDSVLPLCSPEGERLPPSKACLPTRARAAGAGHGQRAHRDGDVRRNLCSGD